jgi:hypothetical protein
MKTSWRAVVVALVEGGVVEVDTAACSSTFDTRSNLKVRHDDSALVAVRDEMSNGDDISMLSTQRGRIAAMRLRSAMRAIAAGSLICPFPIASESTTCATPTDCFVGLHVELRRQCAVQHSDLTCCLPP